jgi:hypothetical protein
VKQQQLKHDKISFPPSLRLAGERAGRAKQCPGESTRHALQPMLTHWFRNFNAFVLALAAGRYIFFFELLNLPA